MNRLRSYRLVWPREVKDEHITTALRSLVTVAGTPLVLDSLGSYGRVEHRLRVVEGRSAAVVTQLRTAIPGLGIEGVESAPSRGFGLAIDLRLSTRRRSLRSDSAEAASHSLLRALASPGKDEAVLLRFVCTDRLRPTAVPSAIPSFPSESLTKMVLSAPLRAPGPADADTRSALRTKQSEPGWRIIGRIAVKAASASRRQQLATSVLGALRQAEAPGVQIRGRTTSTGRLNRTSGHGKLRLNVNELTGIVGWPIGDTGDMPVVRLGSRRLPTPAAVARTGRVLGDSTWPGKPRTIALSPDDSLRHLHLLGPTGTGKSTLLLNLALQDIEAGRGVIVVDPKSDLVADLLARIPERRHRDVVVIDPSDRDRVVGINLLAGGGSPELAADQLLEILHGLYAAHWGPRTNDILGAALHTLARVGGHSLVSVPLLLTDPGFRRKVVGQVHDPIGLEPFWTSFESWSEAERTTAIQPVLNKLRPFLLRQNLRRIVGSTSTSFRFADVFTKRRIVLVDLGKGRIGGEAAALLGALVLAQLWQATLARSGVAAARRHPVNVYLDEFQAYMHLPLDLADALAQARGLGVGFTLAHQHLGQLSPSLKADVLANARSRVCFQLGTDDARAMANTSTILGAEDFAGLDAFHFYAQLVADGQVQPWCSGKTRVPIQSRGDAVGLRKLAAETYGRSVGDIDKQVEALLDGRARRQSNTDSVGDDLAPRRRGGRS